MPECLQSLKQFHFNDAEERDLVAYAKVIGHPTRVRLIRILVGGGCLGSNLVGQIGPAQSTASEH